MPLDQKQMNALVHTHDSLAHAYYIYVKVLASSSHSEKQVGWIILNLLASKNTPFVALIDYSQMHLTM